MVGLPDPVQCLILSGLPHSCFTRAQVSQARLEQCLGHPLLLLLLLWGQLQRQPGAAGTPACAQASGRGCSWHCSTAQTGSCRTEQGRQSVKGHRMEAMRRHLGSGS